LRDKELHLLRNTRPFNIVGAPAIAVGNVQLAAAPGQENTLLALAMKLQEQMSCRH
jgi:Asp-tRNA(Asn)/Glu-tRNA(Gln) amidotransferase A subunit family amidase